MEAGCLRWPGTARTQPWFIYCLKNQIKIALVKQKCVLIKFGIQKVSGANSWSSLWLSLGAGYIWKPCVLHPVISQIICLQKWKALKFLKSEKTLRMFSFCTINTESTTTNCDPECKLPSPLVLRNAKCLVNVSYMCVMNDSYNLLKIYRSKTEHVSVMSARLSMFSLVSSSSQCTV